MSEPGSRPKISIVMPAYNSEEFIGEAIQSVLYQTIAGWELIIVDDGSTDGTASIVNRFKDSRIRYFYQSNKGQSAAQNLGLREVQGEYISFLDSDDRLRPTALQRLSLALDDSPNVCVAYGNAAKINFEGELFEETGRPIFTPRPSGDVLSRLVGSNFIVNGGTLLVRAIYLKVSGGFREDIVMQQDWEMWCRLAAVGEFIFIGHEPVMDYRIRYDSVARIDGSSIDSHWPALKAVFDNPQITEKFTQQSLIRLRRSRESDLYYFVGVEAIRTRNWDQAKRHFINSLFYNYINTKALILLLCACIGWIPSFVGKRVGC